ncbi:hypothetical protein PC116_g29210, partial [Phytophthora cactorum]
MHTPSHHADYSQPTSILVLPAFTIVENVTPPAVPSLVDKYISHAPTTSDPLDPVALPKAIPSSTGDMRARPCPHRVVVLLCSHRTRDARCGQSAPLIKKELERHLRPLGLDRDLDDERPGGVGIYFINHVGGHKYSANVLIYRRPDAFGLDKVGRGKLPPGQEPQVRVVKPVPVLVPAAEEEGEEEQEKEPDVGAAQCIWLARVRPEDCENLVR